MVKAMRASKALASRLLSGEPAIRIGASLSCAFVVRIRVSERSTNLSNCPSKVIRLCAF